MLSLVSRRYLLDYFRMGHATFQSPLIWSSKQQKYALDTSTKFRIISTGVFLLDLASSPIVLSHAIINHSLGLDFYFTLTHLFLLGPTFVNITMDMSTIRHGKERLQLLNSFLQLTNSNGNHGGPFN
jgi:hypothetical protein